MKIDLRSGTKLSEHFSNRRDCYKIVETDHVLGYVVSRGGPESAAVIYPLFRADIHIKAGKIWHIVPSYEQGDRLNDYTFHTDYEGCTFALIAGQAINALEERQRVAQAAVTKTKRASRRKGRSA